VRVGLAVAAAVALVLLAASVYGRGPIQSVFGQSIPETPGDSTLRATQSPEAARAGSPSGPSPASPAQENRRAERGDPSTPNGNLRGDVVGDFCYPDDVPYYGVSSKKEAGNDLIRVLEATVRTRATSETDLTLITRAFKAFYADHDALVLSFESLANEDGTAIGEAYVTNTSAGAFILGMSDGPLNEEGISVVSYVDPATIPQAEVFARTECS
jgi:hypothetical protein